MSDIETLQKELDATKQLNVQLEERAKRFEGQLADMQKQMEGFKGVDLEALKAAKEENEILKRQQKGYDEDEYKQAVEAGIQKQREELQKSIDALSNEKNSLLTQLNEYEVVGKSMELLAGKLKDDMSPFIKDIFRKSVIKEGDELHVFDGDQKLYSKKDASKPMGLEEYCGIIQEKYPSAFKADIPAGTMNKGQRVDTGAGMSGDIVDKLKDPDTAASLSQQEKFKAGLKLAQKYRQY